MNLPPLPRLSTERLHLRPLAFADASSILFLRSNAQVNQYIDRKIPQNIADAEAFIQKIHTEVAQEKSLFWAICLKEDQQMIGSICLWNFSADYKKAEVGYDLHPEHHKKGIMSEALTKVIDFGFEVLQLERIEAYTHRDNIGSRKALAKHHFKLLINKKDEHAPMYDIYELKK